MKGIEGRHIAVFSLTYQPFESGAEIAVRKVAERLTESRFTIFTHRFDARWTREEGERIKIRRLGRGVVGGNYYGQNFAKLGYIFRAWRAAERLHREDPFEAIWAVMAAYAGAAALLFKLRHPRVPLLLTLQEGDSEKHILRRVGWLYPWWRLLFRSADHIQVISRYLESFARTHGAVSPITVVPNGVDQVLKEKRRSQGNSRVIITTSRLVPKNAVDILLRGFALLKKRLHEKLALVIVGDGPERSRLVSLAQELSIAEDTNFVGQVPVERVPEYLASADVFVRPSRSEGLGTSFLEAMAVGVPVIGTAVGGITDFLVDRETGLIVRVDDPENLAHAMETLLGDETLRNRLISNSIRIVKERYDWQTIAEKMENIFETLCAS